MNEIEKYVVLIKWPSSHVCFALSSPDLQDLRGQEQNSNSPCPASSRAMAAGPSLDSALHYPPPPLPWDCRQAWQKPLSTLVPMW